MLNQEFRMEYMRGGELDETVKKYPVAYLPLGAVEFHGHHLPVGLDTLKSSGILAKVAEKDGGVLLPPFYYGTGGGHIGFKWTWMIGEDQLIDILLKTISGLELSGVKLVVLLSGHIPNTEIYDKLIKAYAGEVKILPILDQDVFDDPQPRIDHAGKWETSYMMAMHPERVDLSAISIDESQHEVPNVEEGAWWFLREETKHPWYGIAGMKDNRPDEATSEIGEECIAQFVNYISNKVAKIVKTF